MIGAAANSEVNDLRRRTIIIPLVVALALLMQTIDSTIIATAIPTIAPDLHTEVITMKLGVVAFFVSLGALIPITGRIADRFGTRSVFQAAIAVFLFGSISCAQANDLWLFVIGRLIQGAGAAMMVPVGRLAILRSAPKEFLVSAMTYFTIPGMLGPIIGPPLGGAITELFGWRWIFYVNAPICLLAIISSARYFDNYRKTDSSPIDYIGFLYMAVGCGAVMFGLSTIGENLINWKISCGVIFLGLISFSLYFLVSRKQSSPLLDFSVFDTQTFRISVVGGSVLRIGVGSIPFLVPLLVQVGFGLKPFYAGIVMAVVSIAPIFARMLTAKILRRFGFRTTLVATAAGTAISLFSLGLFSIQALFWASLLVIVINGIFRIIHFGSLNTIAFADVSDVKMSHATSIANAAQEISMGIGVILGGLVVHLAHPNSVGYTPVPSDFSYAFFVSGLLSLSALPFLVSLNHNAGSTVSGHFRSPPRNAEA